MFQIGFTSGLLIVNGTLMRPRDGFTMGSGLRPGGASLAASWREGRLWARATPLTRTFVTARCIMKRWMDDLYILKPKRLPDEVREFFQELTA